MELLVAALLLTIISPSASHNPLTCYGDAREDYYKQSSNYDPYPTESDLPFVADKCQLAREMLEEIQYLRRLMDKCERCPAGMMTNLNGGGNCTDKPCFSETSCIDTGSGAICAPCPVGFDGDGVNCLWRANCNSTLLPEFYSE